MADKTPKKGDISKATANMMVLVSVATLVTVFALVGIKSLLGQAAYQRRLINTRATVVKQLQDNQSASQTLLDQYKNVFIGSGAANAIGGVNTSDPNAVPPNGDNSHIVLDALPITYDYPGLLSSVSKILTSDGVTTPSITGADQSATANSQPAGAPKPTPIKLNIGGQGTYGQVQAVIHDLERSIRPFDITSMQVSGTSDSMTFALTATTYYQVAKSLDLGTQEVR